MNTILEQITEWLKGMLVDGIMNNLSGMFDAVNQQVGDVAAQVGRTPSAFRRGSSPWYGTCQSPSSSRLQA